MNNFISVSEKYYVLVNPDLCTLQDIPKDTSIIYFTEYFKENDNIISTFKENIIIITPKHNNINSKLVKNLNENTLIILNINNSFNYVKFLINSLKRLLLLTNRYNKKISVEYSNLKIISMIMSNDAIYDNDVINCIKAMLISNRNKQYEFIYDTVCDYLDNQFDKCNLCDFKNDKCIANREGATAHNDMGCCYSFEYASIFDFRLVKNDKLCQYLQNKKCTTKNITCKLFTCKYLKAKNKQFDSHKILLLECFLNKKQHDIIQSNFFRTREEILNKLQEENRDLYLWYICFRKYMISNN